MKTRERLTSALLVVAFLAACAPRPTEAELESQVDEKLATHPEFAVWRYRVDVDKMTEEMSESAVRTSANYFQLESNDKLRQRAELAIYNEGNDAKAVIYVKRGQITCDKKCSLLIKLDNEKAFESAWTQYADDPLSIRTNDKSLVKRIKSSKYMTIRVPFYRYESHDIEFKIDGLSAAFIKS